jgi:citrate synthase
MTTPTFSAGLEDVVAAPSSICFIDGDRGILAYRGYNIHDLATHGTFEEVIYLLWRGRLPKRGELEELKAELAAQRAVPPEAIALMKMFPRAAVPMDALRTAVSALGFYDPDQGDNSLEANWRKAARLTAQLATLVAAFHQIRQGREPLAPRKELSHAANFLYLLNGKEPMEVEARALDIALILHADHEFNASTFAARVTAATLSDMYSDITSAIGTLAGPLHGGANEQVMNMLLAAKTPAGAEKFVRDALAAKKKIMGFGHRVYTTEDPRATHLRCMSREIGERQGNANWFEMSYLIEELVKREKGLNANVDFYSASTYYMLGIPIDLFTPVFALSRISGWTAHVLEQYANNRLIRPRAEYTGAEQADYVPIDQR